MNKPFCNSCLIFTLWLIAVTLQSCRQHTTSPSLAANLPVTYIKQVDSLIAQWKKSEGSTGKSILPLTKQLFNINKLTGNKKALVYAEILQATYLWKSADHARAMQTAIMALADAENWKINQAMPTIYRIIANLHKENGNYSMANKEALKGLNIAKLNNDTTAIIEMLGLKAMFTHSYYLKINRVQDDFTSLGLQFAGLKLAESKPKYEKLRIRFYNNIAQVYKDKKAYGKTLWYANKAVMLANKYTQLRSLTYSYCWLGEAYYYKGQQNKGIRYLNDALDISRNIDEPYRQMEIYQSMYNCYLSAQNYKQALFCINRASAMRDSLQLAKNMRQTSDMQLKYETAKKDQQIMLLNQAGKTQNLEIIWILIASVIFLVLFIILMFQYLTIRRNHQVIANKNQVLSEAMLKIAHIQSHEVRKPLASILGLMNVIKAQNYQVCRDELIMVETSTKELDTKIRNIITETENAPAH